MAQKPEEKTPSKLEYKNEQVQFVVHRKPQCVVEYEVEVFRAICFEAHKKAAKSIGKEVLVPGFRKGKAPAELVSKRYPQDLDKRWQEEIANATYQQCAQLANIPVISQDASITFKMHSHTQDGAKLTLSFETIPAIPSIDPAKCVLKEVKRPEVSKEKVEETIRQTQLFFSKWETIEDRPIEAHDFVLMDVDVIEEEPAQRLFTNTRFEVTNKSMAQWMQKLIIGQKVGAVVEGISIPDDNASAEEKNEFPPKKVRVTIKAIEKAELPELNESFAKRLGVENLDILHQRVEEILNKKADEHVREQKREKVTQFLLSHHFGMPPSIIEKETRFRLEQMIKDPEFKTQWDNSTDQERRTLIDDVKVQAEKAVRIFYLCRKIAADQNMSISPKDLHHGATDRLETLLYPYDQHHNSSQPDIKQAEAYSRALLEKTEDWVIAHARTAAPEKREEALATLSQEAPAPLEVTEDTGEEEKAKPKRKSAPKKSSATTEQETLKKKSAKKAKDT